jgi:hypothetical protein
MNNIKFFIVMSLVLGVLVIVVEVGNIIVRPAQNTDSITFDLIIPLPGSFDKDVITRFQDREKYLMLNKEQFLGSAPVTPVTPIPSVSGSPTATVSITPSVSPRVSTTPSISVTPTPTN